MSMQIPIPSTDNFGKVTTNGKNKKVFNPNWKAVLIIFTIFSALFGSLITATIWVNGQTVSQTDTTKKIIFLEKENKTLNRKVDTLSTRIAVEQAGQGAFLEAILRKVDPDNADTLIDTTNRMKEALAKELNKVK